MDIEYCGERMYACILYLLSIDYPASPCISLINSSSEPMALLLLWIHGALADVLLQ